MILLSIALLKAKRMYIIYALFFDIIIIYIYKYIYCRFNML